MAVGLHLASVISGAVDATCRRACWLYCSHDQASKTVIAIQSMYVLFADPLYSGTAVRLLNFSKSDLKLPEGRQVIDETHKMVNDNFTVP
jgi:NitT/TauT family transport system substrate-binding protein